MAFAKGRRSIEPWEVWRHADDPNFSDYVLSGVKNSSDIQYRNGKPYYRTMCPECERAGAVSINLDKHWWHCFHCSKWGYTLGHPSQLPGRNDVRETKLIRLNVEPGDEYSPSLWKTIYKKPKQDPTTTAE